MKFVMALYTVLRKKFAAAIGVGILMLWICD